MRYEATRLYKLSLALPIVVPILAVAILLSPLLEYLPALLRSALEIVMLSGIYGGISYLMLVSLLLLIMRGKNEDQIRRIVILSPIYFIPVFLVSFFIFEVFWSDRPINAIDVFSEIVVGFVPYILGFGYSYVALVVGAIFLLKKRFHKRL